MPSNKDEREDLAWVMCVLMMSTRQLALINKTGQVNFEINLVCRMFIEWVRNMIQQHFSPFFSSMLLLSYDRVIAGYLTRQVATTFMATCARHCTESENMTEANPKVLMDMESAPLTLQSCNLAICNAITHLVDTNLLLVNQIIRDKLGTPVVPPDFLVMMLTGDSIDTASPYYDVMFSWLSRIVQNRQNEIMECLMGYVSVPKLGTHDDYNNKEAYFESFFGMAKNNYYTYLTAVKECCSKCFDLSGFLSMDAQMLDFARFIGRMGVGGDGLIAANQQQRAGDAPPEGYRNTYLFIQNSQPQQGGGDAQQRGGANTKCWVNVIQHLLITSIQGAEELHADNMFAFGANLTEFILSRCTPIQSSPARHLVLESFTHANEQVVPLMLTVRNRPEYFIRAIQDYGALEFGRTSELPAVIGAHPLEDVMHRGAWIQLYNIINNGAAPEEFYPFPHYNGRTPELMLERRYPLMSTNPDEDVQGTILLRENGAAHITTCKRDEAWTSHLPVALDRWWIYLQEKELTVAPLIFRRHAAFRADDEESPPWVAINYRNDGRQFLTAKGNYVLSRGDGLDTEEVPFTAAHRRLLPIGTHILVKRESIHHFGLTASSPWLIGSLRYPDNPAEHELADANQHNIYLTIRMRGNADEKLKVRVVSVEPQHCRIRREHHNPPYSNEAMNHDMRLVI